MNLTFKFHNLKGTGKGKTNKPQETPIDHYDSPGQARNVCFIEANGICTFLNYSYLVSGTYSPDESTITLAFTSHVVTLRGHNLEKLFEGLIQHQLKTVKCIEERYRATMSESEILLFEINLSKTA